MLEDGRTETPIEPGLLMVEERSDDYYVFSFVNSTPHSFRVNVSLVACQNASVEGGADSLGELVVGPSRTITAATLTRVDPAQPCDVRVSARAEREGGRRRGRGVRSSRYHRLRYRVFLFTNQFIKNEASVFAGFGNLYQRRLFVVGSRAFRLPLITIWRRLVRRDGASSRATPRRGERLRRGGV